MCGRYITIEQHVPKHRVAGLTNDDYMRIHYRVEIRRKRKRDDDNYTRSCILSSDVARTRDGLTHCTRIHVVLVVLRLLFVCVRVSLSLSLRVGGVASP